MPPHPPTPQDRFAAIEALLGQLPLGRAFLADHAQRARTRDTAALLEAVSRLEGQASAAGPGENLERLRSELSDMEDVIRRTRRDVAALESPTPGTRLTEAARVLDDVVRTTETATGAILDATEKVQETAWTMRENGFETSLCDELDRHASAIYSACTFQDLTAQHTSRVMQSLAILEQRIVAMNRVWGGRSDEGKPGFDVAPSPTLSNEDLDFVLVDDTAPASAPVVQPSGPGHRAAALAELERLAALPTLDKLKLFT